MSAGDVSAFVYSGSTTFAAAAAVGTNQVIGIPISADSNFMCRFVRCTTRVSTIGANAGRVITLGDVIGTADTGGVPDNPFTIQITESGSDRQWHDSPVDFQAAYGQSSEPRQLNPERLIRPGFLNISIGLLKAAPAALAITVFLALDGYKVYNA